MAGLISVAPAFAADLDAGAQVFAGNCAACHAGGNNVIQYEKTLRKEALEQYLEGGLKESSIIYQVRAMKKKKRISIVFVYSPLFVRTLVFAAAPL